MSFNDGDVDLHELQNTPIEEILNEENKDQQSESDIHYDEDIELFFGEDLNFKDHSHEYEDTDLFYGSDFEDYDIDHLSDHAAFDDLAYGL